MSGLQPVVIYEEDARELAQRLDAFLKASRSSLVILIDRSGQVIAERGYSRKRDAEELAALAAAAFAATEQVARLIGENAFSVLFHQGEERNIHLSVVGESALMLTAFDDRTTLGLVRLYASEAAQSLLPVVQRIQGRAVPAGLPDLGDRRPFGGGPAPAPPA
jgi:predicted regulator of Ras-like GTPase activity (Roadblock/LC7/MglB family)